MAYELFKQQVLTAKAVQNEHHHDRLSHQISVGVCTSNNYQAKFKSSQLALEKHSIKFDTLGTNLGLTNFWDRLTDMTTAYYNCLDFFTYLLFLMHTSYQMYTVQYFPARYITIFSEHNKHTKKEDQANGLCFKNISLLCTCQTQPVVVTVQLTAPLCLDTCELYWTYNRHK